MPAQILRANALALPLGDDTVDLIVTSPPYFALRSYEDGGEHYDGQIGSEPTPAEFLDALIATTAEMARVLKPTGSIFVNLGDKYADRAGPTWAGSSDRLTGRPPKPRRASSTSMAPRKSLLGLPWRYAIRCIDELGLILREEIIWSKPNPLPESVNDRARRSHEQWFHFTISPRYFAAVDELREPHSGGSHTARKDKGVSPRNAKIAARGDHGLRKSNTDPEQFDPRGKLPGSVWTIASEPLKVPEELQVDHFAPFPTEWPHRIIRGWSPTGICTQCGEGRRPVTVVEQEAYRGSGSNGRPKAQDLTGPRPGNGWNGRGYPYTRSVAHVTGYECGCPEATAPTRPAIVLDPFGGTGTTALIADVLGRHGISVDMSADYCRLAGWRTTDPKQRAKAARTPFRPPLEQNEGQTDLLELISDTKEVG